MESGPEFNSDRSGSKNEKSTHDDSLDKSTSRSSVDSRRRRRSHSSYSRSPRSRSRSLSRYTLESRSPTRSRSASSNDSRNRSRSRRRRRHRSYYSTTSSRSRSRSSYSSSSSIRSRSASPRNNRDPRDRSKVEKWDNPIWVVGEKANDTVFHFCGVCDLPIVIYGRLLPCKHVLCFSCATKLDKKCYRCQKPVQSVERSLVGGIFMCFESTDCGRTYLSQRDLQAHIDHRHKTSSRPAVVPSLPQTVPPLTSVEGASTVIKPTVIDSTVMMNKPQQLDVVAPNHPPLAAASTAALSSIPTISLSRQQPFSGLPPPPPPHQHPFPPPSNMTGSIGNNSNHLVLVSASNQPRSRFRPPPQQSSLQQPNPSELTGSMAAAMAFNAAARVPPNASVNPISTLVSANIRPPPPGGQLWRNRPPGVVGGSNPLPDPMRSLLAIPPNVGSSQTSDHSKHQQQSGRASNLLGPPPNMLPNFAFQPPPKS